MEQKSTKNNTWTYTYGRSFDSPEICENSCEYTGIRYSLGEKLSEKGKTLICIGLNPSMAMPNSEDLDQTVRKVRNYAMAQGYGSWIMLNLYSQRVSKPKYLDEDSSRADKLSTTNLVAICRILSESPNADVWCAWGNDVDKREYLKKSSNAIMEILTKGKHTVLIREQGLTTMGNPRHPSPPADSAAIKLRQATTEELNKLKTKITR